MEDEDNLIDCPVVAIWGSDFELVGKAFDVLEVWKGLARNVRGVAIPECGHLPQEEQPERANQARREFLRGWGGGNHTTRLLFWLRRHRNRVRASPSRPGYPRLGHS